MSARADITIRFLAQPEQREGLCVREFAKQTRKVAIAIDTPAPPFGRLRLDGGTYLESYSAVIKSAEVFIYFSAE